MSKKKHQARESLRDAAIALSDEIWAGKVAAHSKLELHAGFRIGRDTSGIGKTRSWSH